MRSRLLRAAVAATLAVALGCEWFEDDGSPTEPVDDVTDVGHTESFTGEVGLGEHSSHQIGVLAAGTMVVTLTALEPLPTLTVGVRVSTVDDADACVTVSEDSSVRVGETLELAVTEGLVYCVGVFDVGNIPSGVVVTYTIDVTVPGADLVRDTFSGAFGLGETSCHEVGLLAEGSAEMTLTSLEPLATRTVGIGIGNPQDGQTCALFAEDRNIVVGQVLLATELDPGAYCTCVFDVGNVFPGELVTYTLVVEHP